MRSTDVRDELADGIDAAALPPMGPDGGPVLTPARPRAPAPPRLCEAGPCRHYHRLGVQIDAQNPMRERRADGTVVEHARVFHIKVSHYCYPDVGIETVLGSEAVLECNRWEPVESLTRSPRARDVRADYDADFAAWEDARQAEVDAANAAGIAAAKPVELVIRFDGRGPGSSCASREPGTTPLERLIELAAQKNGVVLTRTMRVEIDGDVIGNLSATADQLGLPGNTVVFVHLSPKESP